MRPDRPFLRRLAATFLLAAVAGAAPSLARAEDDSAGGTDPARAFAEAVRTLPAPSAEAGFVFTGVLHINGKNLGYARLWARPETGAPMVQWQAGERLVVKGRAVPDDQTSVAYLTPRLALTSGMSDKNGQPTIRWSRAGEGFRLRWTPQGEGAEAQVKDVPHQGSALNTMAATVLFCRHLLAKPGTYATSIFEPEDAVKGEPAFQSVVVTILGEQEFQGRTVLAAQAVKEDKTLTMLFVPDTKALLALRLAHGESKVEILPGDMWVMPAPDPATAGMRAMLGFAAKKLRVLDDAIDWQALHAHALTRMTPAQRKERADPEAWRKALLRTWNQQLQARPVAMMQQFIASQKDAIQQEVIEDHAHYDDGLVRLTFPPMLRGMQMIVGEQEGVWSVVDLPPQSDPVVPKDAAPKDDAPEGDAPKDGK